MQLIAVLALLTPVTFAFECASWVPPAECLASASSFSARMATAKWIGKSPKPSNFVEGDRPMIQKAGIQPREPAPAPAPEPTPQIGMGCGGVGMMADGPRVCGLKGNPGAAIAKASMLSLTRRPSRVRPVHGPLRTMPVEPTLAPEPLR